MATIQDSIILFGDSLTEGSFVYNGISTRLADRYRRTLDVINRGFGGYNAQWGLSIFPKIFPTKEQQAHLPTVRLLTVWFGANDAVLEGVTHQHVPLPTYASSLSSIISLVRSPSSPHYSPHTRIVLITPPPLQSELWKAVLDGEGIPMDRDPQVTRSYAEKVKEVAQQEGVPVVDAWGLLWDAAGGSKEGLKAFVTDGLHLNEKGYEVVYNELERLIDANFPELKAPLARTFPGWDLVDPKNLEGTLKIVPAFPPAQP